MLNWKLKIDNSEIVNKSYPNFWLDLVKFGVEIKYIDDYNNDNLVEYFLKESNINIKKLI